LNEKEMTEFAISGCKGMKYLEEKHIVHRDLAARNFLVEIKKIRHILKYVILE